MRPVSLSKTLAASSANNICLSQTTGAAGDLILNGSAVAGGVATLDTQRQVAITSAGNDATVVFTITGTNDNGNTISEAITGVNANTVATTMSFKTVTRIAASAAVAQAVTVGTNGVGATVPVPLDLYLDPNNTLITYNLVSGSQNVTVQFTADDVQSAAWIAGAQPNWQSVTGLVSQAATVSATLGTPASAVRMVVNSGTGAGQLIVRQAGLTG